MRLAGGLGATLLAAVIAAALTLSPAGAQSPPQPADTEASEIAGCLCQQRDLQRLSANLAVQRRAYDQIRGELDRLDAELQRDHAAIDVNNPQAVEQFRQKLAERDALFQRSTGSAAATLTSATTRYNAAVDQYNTQCANRPRDPTLLAQVQEMLSCPAPPP